VEAASSTSWEEEYLFFKTTDEYLSKRLSQQRIRRFNHCEGLRKDCELAGDPEVLFQEGGQFRRHYTPKSQTENTFGIKKIKTMMIFGIVKFSSQLHAHINLIYSIPHTIPQLWFEVDYHINMLVMQSSHWKVQETLPLFINILQSKLLFITAKRIAEKTYKKETNKQTNNKQKKMLIYHFKTSPDKYIKIS